ncbi:hypothetical protein SAY86_000778 [Trapa natans]|uniref:Transcriptional adapter 1 n=1 Tax=Trapa natans TaxID=22666 RepID=A0AAN7MAX3_TRANT|nr:hypothetical protein SAY86_000778 [Trapa natans]
MFPDGQYSRVDIFELKDQINRKIGHQRADNYFNLLNRFLTAKITKLKFDQLCVQTIGRETISLHNRLIRCILRNASCTPTSAANEKPVLHVPGKILNGHRRYTFESLYGFPSSPRKARSPRYRERKFKDRLSPLGPLGKTHSIASEDITASKQQSATELLSPGSRPPIEVASVEDGEEVEQNAGSPGVQSRSPVTAPLGISVNVGLPRKALPKNSVIGYSSHGERCQDSGFLPDTQSLRRLLMHKLEDEGLKITLDCVNLLNSGLDSYIKRLISPCLSLARSRQDKDRSRQITFETGTSTSRIAPALPNYVCASTLDFRAAMEMNPWVLGGCWYTHLEKISSCALDQ